MQLKEKFDSNRLVTTPSSEIEINCHDLPTINYNANIYHLRYDISINVMIYDF